MFHMIPEIKTDLMALTESMNNSFCWGTVKEVKEGYCRVLVDDEIITDFIPYLSGSTKDLEKPNVGVTALILSPMGELNHGAVIGFHLPIYKLGETDVKQKGVLLPDGSLIIYDEEKGISITAEKSVTINSKGKISLIGDFKITGNLEVTAEIKGNNLKADNTIIATNDIITTKGDVNAIVSGKKLSTTK